MKLPQLRPAWLAWLGLFLATGVWAQSQNSGAITSSQCVTIATTSAATVGIQVTGTWSGTLQPEVSIQGQAAANVQVTPSTSTTAQSTITANGVFTAAVAGASTFLLCGNTVSSGTANVYLNATSATRQSAGGGGAGTVTSSGNPVAGNIPKFTTATNIAPAAAADLIALWTGCSGTQYLGADGACHTAGSGTVTNTGGNLTSNAVVLGAGTNDTKVSTGITTNGASEIDAGVAGGAAGVYGFVGSTSGKATCTAPAVAGTITNPVTCTNVFAIAIGTAGSPSLQNTASGVSGVNFLGNGTVDLIGGAAVQLHASSSFITVTPPLCDAANGTTCWTFNSSTKTLTASGSDNPAVVLSSGGLKSTHLLITTTAPTVSSGFGTGASVTANNGTAAFRINVGTSNTGNGVIGLPTATTGWNCFATDITTKSTSVAQTLQTASTTASATLQNYTDIMGTGAWTDSDVLSVSCFAY